MKGRSEKMIFLLRRRIWRERRIKSMTTSEIRTSNVIRKLNLLKKDIKDKKANLVFAHF